MCCFSGRINLVEKTRIFARRVDDRTQSLAYAMDVAAEDDLAMVLPLPTDPAAGDGAVRFVDLSEEPYLFSVLDAVFPIELGLEMDAAPQASRAKGPTLAVHTVGSFEASFVPEPEDFERLDPRFRLAPAIVDALCARERFGFAVFQLRGLGVETVAAPPRPWWRRIFSGDDPPPERAFRRQHFHPMGLTFRSRAPESLFFPTVHVHDGTLTDTADFDHTFYAQGRAGGDWEESVAPPHVDAVRRTRGVLAEGERLKRRTMQGELPNRDVIVPA